MGVEILAFWRGIDGSVNPDFSREDFVILETLALKGIGRLCGLNTHYSFRKSAQTFSL
jgi:hypothetical protein